jgi:hypothetical protein
MLIRRTKVWVKDTLVESSKLCLTDIMKHQVYTTMAGTDHLTGKSIHVS